ncbi:MAG TPA: hypothetical protein VN837_17920 [Chloroflexota bacterium]|nr:hypothetical protein [Chloroflexota bacterium]
MTKKSDMASRYAAAHARRDQRRRETTAREFLPLADETDPRAASVTAGLPATGGRLHLPSLRGEGVLTSRVPAMDYSYLRADLMRTLILAVCLFGAMIILSFIVK